MWLVLLLIIYRLQIALIKIWKTNENRFLVRPNESTYIKMGQVHRLENEGKIDLVMIEVQVGEYTGEDDIVRLEDVYGR